MLPLWARVDLGVMAIKGVLCISQRFSVTGASPSDCLVSYPKHSLGESYPSAEIQSVYSAAPANWAKNNIKYSYLILIICIQLYGFKYSYVMLIIFKQIWIIDKILTGTATLARSNSNEEQLLTWTPELEPHHQIHFNVILRISLLGEVGFISLQVMVTEWPRIS